MCTTVLPLAAAHAELADETPPIQRTRSSGTVSLRSALQGFHTHIVSSSFAAVFPEQNGNEQINLFF